MARFASVTTTVACCALASICGSSSGYCLRHVESVLSQIPACHAGLLLRQDSSQDANSRSATIGEYFEGRPALPVSTISKFVIMFALLLTAVIRVYDEARQRNARLSRKKIKTLPRNAYARACVERFTQDAACTWSQLLFVRVAARQASEEKAGEFECYPRAAFKLCFC